MNNIFEDFVNRLIRTKPATIIHDDKVFKPITSNDTWESGNEEGVFGIDYNEKSRLTELLVGHKVVKVDDRHLLLDNGTVIKVIDTDGGCSCSAGCYDLSVLNGVDNIITKVEFDYHPAGDFEFYADELSEAEKCNPDQEKYTGHYRIFVYAENEKINLFQLDGTDGNGYYGTGFSILVREA